MQKRTSEYLSPLVLWSRYGILTTPFFVYATLFLAVCAVCFRRIGATFLIIALFLVAISFRSFRYIPFFVFGTAVELGAILTPMIANRTKLRLGSAVLAACAVILLWHGGVKSFPKACAAMNAPVNTDRFPVAAARFLGAMRPPGEIFNHFSWGGYLIWILYPDYRVFIDGRCLSSRAFTDYTRILWTPEWKEILRRNGINTIIMTPVNDFTGELYQLVNYIAQDSEWRVVYSDDVAFVAVNGNANSDLFAGMDVAKIELYRQAAFKGERLLLSGMDNTALWQTLATAYARLGFMQKAAEARNKALSRSR